MIQVENLKKYFYTSKGEVVRAVDGISFKVGQGEIFGLLGPNGAGKTTTLRVISTVLKPTEGTVAIDGFDTQKNPEEVRRHIGFLSSDTGLYRRLTAREMVEYFAELYGMDKTESDRRIDELFERFELTEYADTFCSKLSSGNKQKVNILRTIVHDPPTLVFDEPTIGLDVIIAKTLLDFIKELRAEGKCIIFSTHIMDEAEKLCDRIGIIHRGKIYRKGTLAEITNGTGELEDVFFEIVG